MRVIVTSPSWSLNGVNAFSASLVRGLVRHGVDATILLTGITYVERKGLPIPRDIPVEHLVIPRFATWHARRLALLRLLESRSPCIYFPNHDFLHSSVSSAVSPGVGVVGIVHSDDAQHYDHAARMGRTWNATVAVSETIKNRLSEGHLVDSTRLSMIPYGVEVAANIENGPREKEIKIIYAGRLDAGQKKSGDLIRVAVALRDRGVPFSMLIVGDGPERSALDRAITRNDLRETVKIVTTIGNDRLTSLYREFDAFLLPSAYEGMPLALLEAMGQGCVPFATQIDSGIPQLVRDGQNGFTAPVGDIERFATLLQDFAASPRREQLRHEAWKTVSAGKYRSEEMTAGYLELIRKVEGEMEAGTFHRSGSVSRMSIPLRETIAAPLWSFRPAIRAQQNRHP